LNVETGHFIRIQIPARARTLWLSPAWAVVCGIVASNAFAWTGHDVLIGALAILLADGVWATVWWGLVETDWPQLLLRWDTVTADPPQRAWPLARTGSPADRAQRWLARFNAWWRSEVWPQTGTPILSALVSIALGIVLSAVIGWQALTLSLGAFALTQIGLVLKLKRGGAPHLVHGILNITLAWVLGHAAFDQLNPFSLGVALLFAVSYGSSLHLAYGGQAVRGWLLPQLLLVVLLVLLQQPIAAFALIAVLIAQALLSTVLNSLAFARAAQFWLMMAMMVVAIAIRG
jgi:hypothetical protein